MSAYLSKEQRAEIRRQIATLPLTFQLLDHAEAADEMLAERDRRIADLTAALTALVLMVEEHGRGYSREVEAARAALGEAIDAAIEKEKGQYGQRTAPD